MQAYLRKRVRAGDEVADLCFKDSEAKLHVITEKAPVDPPDEDDVDGKAAFAEEQEDFLKKWRSPVKAAYKKKYPKVII